MFDRNKIPDVSLRVVIRDSSPFIFMQEPVKHRSVRIELTPEQRDQLALECIGKSCGADIYEEISQAFLEENTR